MVFDPYNLSEEVTPEGVVKALQEGNFSAALMMSFRLNEKNLLINSLEATPISDSKQVCVVYTEIIPKNDCSISD